MIIKSHRGYYNQDKEEFVADIEDATKYTADTLPETVYGEDRDLHILISWRGEVFYYAENAPEYEAWVEE